MKKYSADFETAVWLPEESFVWAWAVSEIGNEENITIENNLSSFMEFLEKNTGSIFYFHNLKFDGEFIISYLLENGFEWVKDKTEAKDRSFSTLISDFGVFYQIVIYFRKKKKVTIIDSLKIIPFSVSAIAKSFGLKESKLEIDYLKPRSRNHTLTPEEKDYIKNDVVIVAKALNVIFSEGLTKMTQGANALYDFKKMKNSRAFQHFFPTLEPSVDEEIRKSYRGGFTYLNPIYKEKDVRQAVQFLTWTVFTLPVWNIGKLPFRRTYFFYSANMFPIMYTIFMFKCFRVHSR